MPFSFGGGGSRSRSRSSSVDNVWAPQGNALSSMYGNFNNLWNQQAAGGFGGIQDDAGWAQGYNQGAARDAQGGYQSLLGGGSYGDPEQIRRRLFNSMDSQSGGSNVGRMYQDIIGGPGNEYIDPMVDAMRAGYQENLNRNLGMGELDAAAMGQGGSSRHAMADAMLTRGALQDMNAAETNMRGGAYDTDLNWRMDIARLADQGIDRQQDRLLSMLRGRDENINQGLSQGVNVQNLGMGTLAPTMQAQMMPWQLGQMYAGNMGDPTILNTSSGRSRSSSLSLSGSRS